MQYFRFSQEEPIRDEEDFISAIKAIFHTQEFTDFCQKYSVDYEKAKNISGFDLLGDGYYHYDDRLVEKTIDFCKSFYLSVSSQEIIGTSFFVYLKELGTSFSAELLRERQVEEEEYEYDEEDGDDEENEE